MNPSEENDEIIVFKQFDTAIDGNLAKTKLDAHNIPCFLTEENLSTLYAGQSFRLFGVRLHIFKKDSERVSEILSDQLAVEPIVCPRCSSQNVEIEYSRKPASILTTVFSIFIAALLPNPKVHRCQNCGHEF